MKVDHARYQFGGEYRWIFAIHAVLYSPLIVLLPYYNSSQINDSDIHIAFAAIYSL